MIHDIEPHQYHNEYIPQSPAPEDYFFYFEGNKVLMKRLGDAPQFPAFADIPDEALRREAMAQAEYLFCIDETHFFAVKDSLNLIDSLPGFSVGDLSIFREMQPQYLAFAGITASQIYRFRKSRAFCGKCGHEMVYGTVERSMCCPACGNVEYPKISPAVTVAIINGDKLLMARSAAGSFRRFALVAGYVEIGESFEKTVHREVMEEVGLKVKNVTYYKSQPWAFSDTEMIGFFCQLDGDDTITVQESELSEARWFSRDEIEEYPSISLTYEMVNLFREGREPKFN